MVGQGTWGWRGGWRKEYEEGGEVTKEGTQERGWRKEDEGVEGGRRMK
jgi:hypothetical protein